MRKLLSAALLLLASAVCMGQSAGRVDNQVIGPKGPLPNVIVTVCAGTATGIPCSPPIQTYIDSTLTTQCALGLPVTLPGSSTCQVTTDALGNFGFWLPVGSYKYSLTGPGITGKTYDFTLFSTIPAGVVIPSSGTIETGTGTTNKVSKFVNGAAGVQGDSGITDNGTIVTIGNTDINESTGLVSRYNGNTTAAAGLLSVVGFDRQIARTTNVSPAVTLFATGANTALYTIMSATACTTTSAAATVQINLIYTDTSNTVQTVSGASANCTTLGANSAASLQFSFMAKNGTNIQYTTTIANTPTYDVRVAILQASLN